MQLLKQFICRFIMPKKTDKFIADFFKAREVVEKQEKLEKAKKRKEQKKLRDAKKFASMVTSLQLPKRKCSIVANTSYLDFKKFSQEAPKADHGAYFFI